VCRAVLTYQAALVALASFLIATGSGVAATWYGSLMAIRPGERLPNCPRSLVGLVRLRPSRRPCPGAPFTASRDQLGAISHSLAPVRQSPDKLTSDIAKLQAAKPDTPGPDISVSRTSAPPPAAVVTGRKVVTPASQLRRSSVGEWGD
jgi:hypothetical protein